MIIANSTHRVETDGQEGIRQFTLTNLQTNEVVTISLSLTLRMRLVDLIFDRE